jgi:hypothetical protein
MSLLREQWITNVSELWLDRNRIYNKLRKPQEAGCFLEPRVDRLMT